MLAICIIYNPFNEKGEDEERPGHLKPSWQRFVKSLFFPGREGIQAEVVPGKSKN